MIALIDFVVPANLEYFLHYTICSGPLCKARAQLVWSINGRDGLQPRCFKHGPSVAARKRSKLIWRRRPYCQIGEIWDLN